MKRYIDDIAVNTIVGEGSFVAGNVNSMGFTKIDGDVKGNIVSKGRVTISQNARVKGSQRRHYRTRERSPFLDSRCFRHNRNKTPDYGRRRFVLWLLLCCK